MNDVNVTNCKDVIIKVFIIGYRKRGESIVVLFVDKVTHLVIYSIVIDSFKCAGNNKTIEILKSYNIKVVDLLCWSHPDIDHTWGIDDILQSYCSPTTKIVIPFALSDPSFNSYKYNKRDKEYLDYIFSLNRISLRSCISSSVAPDQYSRIERFFIKDTMDQISVAIDTLSPHSSFINSVITTNGKIDKNQLSIVLCISVNSYKFVFCSDIENDAIKFLQKEPFDNPLFLKIPHHGSPSSGDLISLMETSLLNTIGCSTIYRRHNLPNSRVLKMYSDRCAQVDCTGTDNIYQYGIVEYCFDLFDCMTCDAYYHGHAKNYS